jgi:hypothetical protein
MGRLSFFLKQHEYIQNEYYNMMQNIFFIFTQPKKLEIAKEEER